MARRVLVVGAGITGTAVAAELASAGVQVTVVDRDRGQLRGSTAFAPGFVGLFNDAAILTELARASAAVYDTVGAGFRRSGGLELATSDSGADEIARRVAAAAREGLAAKQLDAADLPAEVVAVVDASALTAVGYFPQDGVADPTVLTQALRSRAEARGARFVWGIEVLGIEERPRSEHGRWVVAGSDGHRIAADDLVVAVGVWGPNLTAGIGLRLPLFPVAHPYVYSARTPHLVPGPFIRWPEHHVYARVHGDRLGIGSYDHAPVPVSTEQLHEGAGLTWRDSFDAVIDSAQQLLHPSARVAPVEKINGVFAMTPDNLPYVGPHPDLPGLWIAEALWITHAAGAAAALAAAMVNGRELPAELAVDRHTGADAPSQQHLQDAALRLYRDIYANNAL